MSEEGQVVLVCGSDENYAAHMAAMLTSVIKNYSGKYDLVIYVFDNGLSTRTREIIQEISGGRVRWVEPDMEQLSGLKVTRHISESTYLRLLVPNALPDNVDKVLYLDVDLVVEHDITELWETDIEGQALGAAQDATIPYVSDPSGLQLYKERGLDADHPYFNAGVLLINLEFWRERSVAQQVFEYLRRYEDEVIFWDQDGLNYILANDWKVLDRRWNVHPKAVDDEMRDDTPSRQSLRDDVKLMQDDPYIIHYIGPDKPWMYGVEVRWQERYFHYLRESGWFSSEWKWKKWRLKKALNYYRRCLSTTSHRLYSELKRCLVPVARLLGLDRSRR